MILISEMTLSQIKRMDQKTGILTCYAENYIISTKFLIDLYTVRVKRDTYGGGNYVL